MAFPETPRVVYQHNPLEEVRCDIAFPPILKIDDSPIAFQDLIRSELPNFNIKSSIQLPANMPQHVSRMIGQSIALPGTRAYHFASEDCAWELILTTNRFSLLCRQYRRWEQFRDKLRQSLDSFNQIYKPSFFQHSCVRYKNAIRRIPLGLAGIAWPDLLQPWVIGPLQAQEISGEVQTFQGKCVIRLPGSIGSIEATFTDGTHQPSNERVFIIESHSYNDEKKGTTDVFERLNALHHQTRLFFRWCITDRLHLAMQPTSVDS